MSSPPGPSQSPPVEFPTALRSCRGAFVGIGLISAVLNVLLLTGAFFMLAVYDRVLPSRSLPTLVALALLALGLYLFQAVLDVIRGRVLVRIGAALDEALSGRIYDMIVRLPLKVRPSGDGLQPLRDFDQVRNYLSGLGPTALFDLPWLPFYLGICYLFHPLIGLTALIGALVLVALTLIADVLSRAPARHAAAQAAARNALADASRRNAEAVHAMGMAGRLAALWGEANASHRASQRRAADITGGLGSVSKVLRMMLQLSGDHAGGQRRHHHRGRHSRFARGRTGGACDRELEGSGRGPPGLGPAEATRCAVSAAIPDDPIAGAAQKSGRRGRDRAAAGRPKGRRAGRFVPAERR